MKLSFLVIAGLIISSILVSMTDRTQPSTTVLDHISVTDLSTMVVTNYTVEQFGTGGGSVVIHGTLQAPPEPNNDGGRNYRCNTSQEICYSCTGCSLQD